MTPTYGTPSTSRTDSDVTASDRWFFTNGVLAMGPVSFTRIDDSQRHGSVSSRALVRHESWKVWRRLRDVQALDLEARDQLVARLGGLSAEAPQRASGPNSEPPPPLEVPGANLDLRRDSSPPLSTIRPAAVDPVGVLSRATNLDEALLLTLSTSVAAVNADVGLLHQHDPTLGAMVTSCVHGADAEAQLGERVLEQDPSLLAARAGHTIIAEPQVGQVGRYIAGRLCRGSGRLRGVAMVPIEVNGRLAAMLEVGRSEAPFRAREIGRVEDIVEALIAQIIVGGWLDETSGVRLRPKKSKKRLGA